MTDSSPSESPSLVTTHKDSYPAADRSIPFFWWPLQIPSPGQFAHDLCHTYHFTCCNGCSSPHLSELSLSHPWILFYPDFVPLLWPFYTAVLSSFSQRPNLRNEQSGRDSRLKRNIYVVSFRPRTQLRTYHLHATIEIPLLCIG